LGDEVVELVAEAVGKDRVLECPLASVSFWDRKVLVGRLPVVPGVSAPLEVSCTAQFLGTEALGHPACHLGDVTKLRGFDEDALDAQGSEFVGSLCTSRRI
jgi:hypothetical protein